MARESNTPRGRSKRSRSRSPRNDKRGNDKKDKKAKRHVDDDRSRGPAGDSRDRRRRSPADRDRRGGKDEVKDAKDTGKDSADDGELVRTTSRPSGAWREEMAQEEDDVMEGIAAMEDDEEVERKVAESRARREALLARWVNKGEVGGDQSSTDVPATPMAESDSEEDVGDGPADAGPREKDQESIDKQKEINRFILKYKAEHDGDMFGDKDDEALNRKELQSAAISQTGASSDDWDDQEGYYRAKIGEIMDGRYLCVEDKCGQGTFSNVVKCKDQQDGNLVAIKVMRCNDMMRKAAEKEVEVLERLKEADKHNNKKHVITLLRQFFYRGHLCLVFECMWDNLRVALKKYTKDKGMSLQAVRAYTKQLLIGMRLIHRCHIIHADIKPDNILVSDGHNMVKICDLGSAMEENEVEPTPYLVSRFYRSPEIILGKEYGPPTDIFALGATLYEIFTGKIMFPGKTNNDMLRLFMEMRGKLPHRMIKGGTLWKRHFDQDLEFQFVDIDKLTRKKIVRTVTDCSAKTSISDKILARVGSEKQKSENPDDVLYVKKAKQFAELLGQMTAMDPDKRPDAHTLLQHPFLTEAGPAGWPGSKPQESQPKPEAKPKDAKDSKDAKDTKPIKDVKSKHEKGEK